MIQSLSSSCFSSTVHLQPERGALTSLRRMKRNRIILNGDKKNIIFTGFSDHKILDPNKSFGNSCDKRIAHRIGATSDGEFVLQPKDDIKKMLTAIYNFSRPYTFIGIIIAISSVSLLPFTSLRDLSPALFVGFFQSLIPFLFLKIYVAGINQVFDVEVDKINKPYLPLVSGELSMGQGKAIVWASGFMCLAVAVMFKSPPLFFGNLTPFLLGTAYSADLPYLRWKTKPTLAALSIAALYGLSVNLGVFCHMQKYVLGRPLVLTKSLGFTVTFFTLFSVVIALSKDIPDVRGDLAFGNPTFSVKYGRKKVFSVCLAILLTAYGSGIVIGASSSFLICKLVSVIGHSTLASVLLLRANSLDLDDDEATQSFYMFIWKLFYVEYALIHFIR
ncbi:umbelliferone 6-dimethylallyltransferase, chloroplastic [Daucus carota subsp. sativus]|uniref:umbelliferone 6-dimethylallyltransferase, chloroplastic n=1 Tax=Daucus carota subsp. sativus TaxID=79200 RepID=UPI0007EFC880|nr:PREDICTED: probable homogentisate phytyltransferase 1, chloroplastic [Daucus carota subsp. sativus]